MTLSKHNKKLVRCLELSCDEMLVEEALRDGEITPRQATLLKRSIGLSREIRENPIHYVRDDAGKIIGEAQKTPCRTEWIACKYGPDIAKLPHFADLKGVIEYVGGVECVVWR